MKRIVFNKESTKDKRRNLKKNQTEAEEKLWEILRDRRLMGLKFRRQYGIGEYIADFYCAEKKIVIEVDGNQHYTADGIEYDRIREEFMKSLGIRTIRIGNYELSIELERITTLISS